MSAFRRNLYRLRGLVFAATTVILLGAFYESEPTIDTSSKVAFDKSISEVRANLSDADQERLTFALYQIMVGDQLGADTPLVRLALIAALVQDEQALLAKLRPVVEGKTSHQVIRIADDQSLDRYKRQLVALGDEISELKSEVEVAEAALEVGQRVLDEIPLTGARYYWSDDLLIPGPVVEFRVTNNSREAIRKIFVQGLLETPGRSIPWVDDSFYFEFKGGLEPGENRYLKLTLGGYGDWGNEDLKARDDLVLTLTLTNIENANEERLIDFDDADVSDMKKRLRLVEEQESMLLEKIREIEERVIENRS